MPDQPTCTADGCTRPADGHCGQPDADGGPQGCADPYCAWHLYPTSHYGDLCADDYANVDHYDDEETDTDAR